MTDRKPDPNDHLDVYLDGQDVIVNGKRVPCNVTDVRVVPADDPIEQERRRGSEAHTYSATASWNARAGTLEAFREVEEELRRKGLVDPARIDAIKAQTAITRIPAIPVAGFDFDVSGGNDFDVSGYMGISLGAPMVPISIQNVVPTSSAPVPRNPLAPPPWRDQLGDDEAALLDADGYVVVRWPLAEPPNRLAVRHLLAAPWINPEGWSLCWTGPEPGAAPISDIYSVRRALEHGRPFLENPAPARLAAEMAACLLAGRGLGAARAAASDRADLHGVRILATVVSQTRVWAIEDANPCPTRADWTLVRRIATELVERFVDRAAALVELVVVKPEPDEPVYGASGFLGMRQGGRGGIFCPTCGGGLPHDYIEEAQAKALMRQHLRCVVRAPRGHE